MSLESHGLDRVRSLWKIPTRLRGTNFYTTSARFAFIFVKQPNGYKCTQIVRNTPKYECCNATNCPKCTKIVRNATKHEVRAQWGGSSGLLWKIPTRLHGTNFCTTSARFAPSFVRQPNVTKCTQIIRNTPKHEYRVQWRGSGAFIAKNYDATSWHLLL